MYQSLVNPLHPDFYLKNSTAVTFHQIQDTISYKMNYYFHNIEGKKTQCQLNGD